jgi:hypothetical protein
MMNENSTKILKFKLLKTNFPIFPTSGIYLAVKTGKNHPVFTSVVFTTPTLTVFTLITEKFLQFVSSEKHNNTKTSANVY